MSQQRPRIYLAGPGVFRRDAISYGVSLKEICDQFGCEGVWPLDNEIANEVARDGLFAKRTAELIYNSNIQKIIGCSAVVADLTPFRGPHMDPGTAFEIGYAVSRLRPIFAFTTSRMDLASRVGCELRDGELRDAQGFLVENFGLVENLMIAITAGRIHPTARTAIEAAAGFLRRGDPG